MAFESDPSKPINRRNPAVNGTEQRFPRPSLPSFDLDEALFSGIVDSETRPAGMRTEQGGVFASALLPSFDLDDALCCPVVDSPRIRAGQGVLLSNSPSFDLDEALCCPIFDWPRMPPVDANSRNIPTPEILVSGMPTASEGGTCAVCMEELGGGACGKRLPCSHAYHQGCILQWLVRESSCPLCRSRIRPE
ncbi:E3 ubiquitin-protein ligase [Nymphaea thermarum]|nr:E3 ubiquitin-protein ligase [Nymphaea thermarum]